MCGADRVLNLTDEAGKLCREGLIQELRGSMYCLLDAFKGDFAQQAAHHEQRMRQLQSQLQGQLTFSPVQPGMHQQPAARRLGGLRPSFLGVIHRRIPTLQASVNIMPVILCPTINISAIVMFLGSSKPSLSYPLPIQYNMAALCCSASIIQ